MSADFAPPNRRWPVVLNALVEKLKRRSKDDFKGRHFEATLILQAAVLLLGLWAAVMRFGSGWEGSGGRLSPTGLGAAWRRPGCTAARSRRRTPDSWSGPAGSGRSACAAQASCEPCAMRPRPDRTRCGSRTPAD